ncbi:MAG TPA: cytochrome c [Lacunisphaera sp.]|jgi:hypothetical protein
MKSGLLVLFLFWSGVQAAESVPTWATDIAPLIYRNCVECHRPGQVGPFSLLGYKDAAKRARFITKAIKARYMPPWLPDGPADTFLDERHLSASEVDLLVRWAAAGAPAGDLAQAPAPPSEADDGWTLGKPDLIVRMRQPFNVPPGPSDSFRVFPVPFSLEGVPAEVLARAKIPDSNVLGVAAIEFRPGNRRVFHHAAVWVDPSGEARKREIAEGGNGYESFGSPGFSSAILLGIRVPGMTPRFLPHGIAASVMPLSGDLAFQIHYRATGKPETDQSEVGIYFVRESVRRIMDTIALRSFKLDIPAGEAAFTVEDSTEVPADCALMNIWPHMHLLAREVHVTVVNPDGSVRPLLDISRWNFKWQDRYVYREPFILSKGARIHCRWIFDNSAANPSNPFSPPRPVQFGPDATDEMCAVDLGVIPINLADMPLFPAALERKIKEKVAELSPEQRARHNWDEAFEH